MINRIKKHWMLVLNIVIFMIVFTYYFLFVSAIEVFEMGYNAPLNFLDLFTTIFGIGLVITVFYYFPLVLLVSYNPEFPIYITLQNHLIIFKDHVATYVPIKNIYKLNNVVRC